MSPSLMSAGNSTLLDCPLDDVDADDDAVAFSISVAVFAYLRYKLHTFCGLAPSTESLAR